MAKINIKGDIINNSDKWIYDWLGYDSTCPNDVQNVIKAANGEKLEVEINSGGGDVFSGSEIYTALKSYQGEVEIQITGIAASAASVIAMSGNCKISPTAMMMVHNVSGGARGDHKVMTHTSKTLKTANEAVANAYIAKTGMSIKDALAMMEIETWFSAQQAVEKGLVDGVMFENTSPFSNMFYNSVSSVPRETIDKIRNTVNKPNMENNQKEVLEAKLKLLNLKEIK